MSDYIISYDFGYHNWYVGEFYSFFHKKIEEKTGLKFEHLPISQMAQRFGHPSNNHSDSLFNWFNLIILNTKTEKMFVHSWYDYACVTIDWCHQHNFNIAKFSCVSNLSDDYLAKYDIAQPSVYCLENWSDHKLIKNHTNNPNKVNKSYFAALSHGLRSQVMNTLNQFEFFDVFDKTKPEEHKTKEKYYQELSTYRYGLSLNGAANICYRDLELFGLGVINLRQPLNCNTFNPLIPDVHYINFLDNDFISKIHNSQNVENEIKDKINFLEDFYNSNKYNEMIDNSNEWYINNCLPENQFEIIYSFLDDLEILN